MGQVWLRQSGHDTIRVERDGDVPVLVRDGVRPHRFLVTAYDDGLAEVDRRAVDLDAEPVRLEDWLGRVVVPNAHGETFARVRLDERSWSAVEDGLGALEDDLARAVLWATAMDAVAARDLTAGALPHPGRPAPARRAARRPDHHASPTRRSDRSCPPECLAADAVAAHEGVAAACRAGLDSGGDPLSFTRGLARASRDADEVDTDGWPTTAPTTTWPSTRSSGGGWCRRLARLGGLDALEIEEERGRDGTADADLGAATALAARPTPEAKAEALGRPDPGRHLQPAVRRDRGGAVAG